MQPEIQAYFRYVAEKYGVPSRVRYRSAVVGARWDAASATWVVQVQDLRTKAIKQRRCKILVSAVGALSTPQECDIPGASMFRGRLFHSAQWDKTFEWEGKEVVVIGMEHLREFETLLTMNVGNGCSATQIIPTISQGAQAVKRITQFSRQAHWLAERFNPDYSPQFKWMMRWVPGAMRLYRAWIYYNKELSFRGFCIKGGEKIREQWAKDATAYILRTAPEQYRDALIPKSVIGCKRRVNDTGYLRSLHQANVELVHDDAIATISENGINTASGRFVPADAIILATGFQTHRFLFPIQIVGESGMTLQEHVSPPVINSTNSIIGLTDLQWDRISEGTSSAYFGTCISGFPNFFTMMGPNTVTGHLSVIYTVECQINFTMRVIAPIMKALKMSRRSAQPSKDVGSAHSVAVKPEAELRDNHWIQQKCKELVWSTGCTSWFIDPRTGRNTQMYPQWMFLYWVRSFWIPWDDFAYRGLPSSGGACSAISGIYQGRPKLLGVLLFVAVGCLFTVASLQWLPSTVTRVM